MKILHIVPGLDEVGNGIAVAARRIAGAQRTQGHEVFCVDASESGRMTVCDCAEVWVHSLWTPCVWRACWRVLCSRSAIGLPRLVRMPHGGLSPLQCRYHGGRKRLVGPIERWLFARTDRVVVAGGWEMDWCRAWGLENEFETFDLRKSFDLTPSERRAPEIRQGGPLRVLYLGRRHPMKGIRFLEEAVLALNSGRSAPIVTLRVESGLSGSEREAAWAWADILCLPSLSENFGLVVAEALERGIRVVTTDGAPAWEELSTVLPTRLSYLRGYREGDDATRVKLLREALSAHEYLL